MSPLKINILLHYYACPTDYKARFLEIEPQHAKSMAVAETLQSFVDDGLLISYFGDVSWYITQDPREYKQPLFSISDKGRAMVDHLMAVQIPICQWVQPTQELRN